MRPARLHDADGLVAVRGRPRLADEHRARRPLAAHADAEHGAPQQQLQTLWDVAAPSEQSEKITIVPISARVRPSRSARYPKISPPKRRHQQRYRAEQPGHRVVEAEVGAQLPDGHGVEHEVHGVEHPAGLGGGQHVPLLARDGGVPRCGDSRRSDGAGAGPGCRHHHCGVPARSRMVISSSSSSNGFATCAAKPAARAFSRSSARA